MSGEDIVFKCEDKEERLKIFGESFGIVGSAGDILCKHAKSGIVGWVPEEKITDEFIKLGW